MAISSVVINTFKLIPTSYYKAMGGGVAYKTLPVIRKLTTDCWKDGVKKTLSEKTYGSELGTKVKEGLIEGAMINRASNMVSDIWSNNITKGTGYNFLVLLFRRA